MEKELMKKIEAHFKGRVENFNLKPGKKFANEEAAFFSGAMAALTALVENPEAMPKDNGEAMPPKWVFGIMRGGIEFED